MLTSSSTKQRSPSQVRRKAGFLSFANISRFLYD